MVYLQPWSLQLCWFRFYYISNNNLCDTLNNVLLKIQYTIYCYPWDLNCGSYVHYSLLCYFYGSEDYYKNG